MYFLLSPPIYNVISTPLCELLKAGVMQMKKMLVLIQVEPNEVKSKEWLRPPTPTLMLFLFSALTPGICKQITQSDDWHDLQLFSETKNLYGVVKMAGR